MPFSSTAACSIPASGHEYGTCACKMKGGSMSVGKEGGEMSAILKNDLLLRALLREPTPRRPIWLMRQAGRYLPEYRATRERAGGFLEKCNNPDGAGGVSSE